MIEIAVFELGYVDTNAYLLYSPETKEAVLFDAPGDSFEVVNAYVRKHQLKLTTLYFTHGHWDHMMDGAKFHAAGLKTYANKADEPLFSNPRGSMRLYLPGSMPLEPVPIDGWLEDGEKITILGQTVEVRHVPGHCPGNILFYFEKENKAIAGDAIFAGSIGRTDLPGGDFLTLAHSIRTKIYTLPKDCELLPGHGPSTNVGWERENNNFVHD